MSHDSRRTRLFPNQLLGTDFEARDTGRETLFLTVTGAVDVTAIAVENPYKGPVYFVYGEATTGVVGQVRGLSPDGSTGFYFSYPLKEVERSPEAQGHIAGEFPPELGMYAVRLFLDNAPRPTGSAIGRVPALR